MTIMFLEIANFSEKTATMSASELVHLLNRVFTDLDNITDKYGVFKVFSCCIRPTC